MDNTLASKCDYTSSTDHSKNSHNTKSIHSAKDILLIKTLPQKMNCCSHKVNLKARSVFRSCFILFFTYSYVFLLFVFIFSFKFYLCVFMYFTYPLMVRMFLIFSLMCWQKSFEQMTEYTPMYKVLVLPDVPDWSELGRSVTHGSSSSDTIRTDESFDTMQKHPSLAKQNASIKPNATSTILLLISVTYAFAPK